MAQHKKEFLAEMSDKLLTEKKDLTKKLNSIAHKEGQDYQPRYPEYGRNDEDNATEIADFQATASTEVALEERLKEINSALERLKAGTYGLTEDGELIPEDRLRANPAATTVIK
jgi:RNA polymerase-binding transcription factor DksA